MFSSYLFMEDPSGVSVMVSIQVRIHKGGGGYRGSGPPGKSQVIWVSLGKKQLELDPPGKSWTPPWKKLDPLWNLEKSEISLKLAI